MGVRGVPLSSDERDADRLYWPAFCWAIRQVENGPEGNPFCWTGVFRADLRRLEIQEDPPEAANRAWLLHYRPGCNDVTELARVYRYGPSGASGPDVEDYGRRVRNLYEWRISK